MRILVIFGTRPEAIKLAPVVQELYRRPYIDVRVCVTAQHRTMLDQVLDAFEITPDYDLDIMHQNQTLCGISERITSKLPDIYRDFEPEWVIVQGDTTTTFIAALSAYYHQIAIAHVEAGLRTDDIYSPWPEEGNRRLTSAITTLHFAPTNASRKNLLIEGYPQDSIFVTGNTVIDALLSITQKMHESKDGSKWESKFSFIDVNKKLLLVTGHRRENFGIKFENICHALYELAKRPDVQIVYPVHLNPNVQAPVTRILGNMGNVILIDPLDYVPFVYLMKKSYIILTDSGGVQEEAPTLGKPVLVMREKTERIEAIEAGTALLVGTDTENIVFEASKLLDSEAEYQAMSNINNPYGDGRASEMIVDAIMRST
jgi:UDP-N-acetylglucosamine 2-epimerase (non-hydrolysing)